MTAIETTWNSLSLLPSMKKHQRGAGGGGECKNVRPSSVHTYAIVYFSYPLLGSGDQLLPEGGPGQELPTPQLSNSRRRVDVPLA